jgi:acyl-coenzyme A thioesterase 9
MSRSRVSHLCCFRSPFHRLLTGSCSPTAATCDLYTGEKVVTNVFHYTFSSERPLSRHVVPRTYRQAMQWLDAQRRRRIGIDVRQTYTKAL